MEGDASTWAASRLLAVVVHRIARRMAGASAARRRTAPSQLSATRGFVGGTAVASDASTWDALRLLKVVVHRIARRMAGASAARRRTAPSQLKAVRLTARRMGAASAVRRRTASN